MIARIGDDVYHPVLVRCEGCCQTLLMCQVLWDEDDEPCCGVCTHLHDVSPRPNGAEV